MVFSKDRCKACDESRHEDCNGIAVIVDQDGSSRYVCGCDCNKRVVEEKCDRCHGEGVLVRIYYDANRGRGEGS